MIKYSPTIEEVFGEDQVCMEEDPEGAYVKYSDVEGLINGAKMLRELMTNHENEFRIEAKDLATTMLAGEMIESFREALKKSGG